MSQPKDNGPKAVIIDASGNTYDLGNGAADVTVNAGSQGDSIVVGDGPVQLADHGHNNTITLGNGPHTVVGGASDNITIGNGQATVTGGNNDTIILGAGLHSIDALNDTITVGAGKDTFVFDRGTGSRHATNFSTINGFDPTHDTIDISKSVFGVSSFTDANLHITQSGSNAVISNGSGHLQITLTDVHATALTAKDFKFT